jgi:hypothetical protein
LDGATHSVYRPLWPLLNKLVDRHWVESSKPRNDPGCMNEAFQCSSSSIVMKKIIIMHCRVGSQPHPPELISRFPSLSSDITQLVGLRDTCPLSRRHRGALALKGLPFIRSGRCATPLHANLQLQLRYTRTWSSPALVFVVIRSVLLWQLYIHSRESFKIIKMRTKQTYRISSSPTYPTP